MPLTAKGLWAGGTYRRRIQVVPPSNYTVSSTGGGVFNGPGSLGLLVDGVTLSCVYGDNGTLNYGSNGGMYSKTSTDGGVTWGSPTTVVSPVSLHFAVPRTMSSTLLANNKLCCGINNGLTSQILGSGTAPAFYLQTTDGLNYSSSNEIDIPSGMSSGVPTASIVQESGSGDLIWGWVGARTGDTVWSVVLMKCASGNDPLTAANWGPLGGSVSAATAMRDSGNTSTGHWYDEVDVKQLNSTTWIAVSRNDPNGGSSGPLRYSIGTGTYPSITWGAVADLTTTDGKTSASGVAPVLTILSGGILRLDFGERGSGNTYMPGYVGLVTTISLDNGSTWLPFVPVSVTTVTTHDIAYSSSAKLTGTSCATVYPIVTASDGTACPVFYCQPNKVVVNAAQDTFTLQAA